jgi:hypothetical protein
VVFAFAIFNKAFELWKMKTQELLWTWGSFLLLFLLLGLTHVIKKIRRLSLFLFIGAGIALIFIFSKVRVIVSEYFLRNYPHKKQLSKPVLFLGEVGLMILRTSCLQWFW